MANRTLLFFLSASAACLALETRAAKQVKAKTLLRSRLLDADSTRDSKNERQIVEPTKKPQPGMDPISIMRGEMCLGRQELIEHSKCIGWLVEECTSKSAGTGLCTRVRAHVKEKCIAKNEKACDYAKVLGVDIPGEEVTTPPPATTPAPVAAPAPAQEKPVEKVANETPVKNGPKQPENEPKAPAPAPKKKAATVAPTNRAPAPKTEKDEGESKKEQAKPVAKYEDPKAKDGLQSQGFSGKKVKHSDGKSVTGDWGKEYANAKGWRIDWGKEDLEPKSGARSWNMPTSLCLVAAMMACLSG